jgi:hypothetical protein
MSWKFTFEMSSFRIVRPVNRGVGPCKPARVELVHSPSQEYKIISNFQFSAKKKKEAKNS